MAYEKVNDQWPDKLPPLTGPEAITALKRLYRFGMKRRLGKPVKLTSGRRYTAPRGGVWYVNPEGHHFGGWRDLVHDVSHRCHWLLYRHEPNYRPHDSRHHWLERDMVAYVIRSGWLEGKLRREPKPKPAISVTEVRYGRIVSRIKKWEVRAKRAENTLRNLRKKRREYERRIGRNTPVERGAVVGVEASHPPS